MMEDLRLIQPGEVRVRIAPSPTGSAHIGLGRTALFNYLFAKKYQGIFVLRIEDTDTERSKKEFEREILESLKWLGIEWQEGPDISGPYSPYRQSERKQIYEKYIKKLLQEGKAYYCFCSPEELEAHRQYLMSIGQPPRYSGKCRNLTPEEVEKNLAEGKPYVIRLKTQPEKVVFEDLIRGKIETHTDDFGDIVIAKDLQTPLYNLACVIDDWEMKITHVIRGEDHIPNTPKQVVIAKYLGITPPVYAHLPLILGPDRSKLSKRHGAKSILEYKKEGYLPEALVNFLALLGWHPAEEKEIFPLSSIVQEFSIKKIQKSGAVFNIQKLDWLNGFYIRQKSTEKLTELCLPYLIENNLIKPKSTDQSQDLRQQEFIIPETQEIISFEKLKQIISLYQERLKKLSEISSLTDFFFKKELSIDAELLRWKDMTNKELKSSLDISKKVLHKIKESEWTKENIYEHLINKINETFPEDRGKVLWPLRVALTGKKASAPPFEVAEILGKEKTIDRIKKAINLIK